MIERDVLEMDLFYRDFAARHIGGLVNVEFCGNDHAESLIWRVEGVERTAYFKFHRQPRKFNNEYGFYRKWASEFAGNVPEFIAVCEGNPSGLLVSEVSGLPLERLSLADSELETVYRQAGGFLRKLHDLPFSDTDTMPLNEALERRCERYCRECRDIFDREVLEKVAKAVRLVTAVEGLQRVLCHRDYSPRNWLVNLPESLLPVVSVIDFEHSQGDCAAVDFQRLLAGNWRGRDDLREAFCSGYGKEKSRQLLEISAKLLGLYALGTVHWALNHADREFEKHGRDTLDLFLSMGY